MHILIIPGFTGYPEEKTFEQLTVDLEKLGHIVTKLAWPNFPDNLDQYSFTATIKAAREYVKGKDSSETVILGFSMGGIIATLLAREFKPKKLGLIVSPYQAGSNDDIAGKYKEWKEQGWRIVTSSRFGELKIPFSFIEDAQKYNALDYIIEVECPVLFIVGENDDKVPMSVSKQLYDKANKPKVWRQIKEMEHKYQYQPDKLEEVNRNIIQFIQSK